MRPALALVLANAAVLTGGALAAGGAQPTAPRPVSATQSTVAAAPAPVPTTAPVVPPAPVAAARPAAPRPAATAPRPAPVARPLLRTGWRPYAQVGPVTLHFPGEVVEVVGLHQSGHDGAQPQSPVPGLPRVGLLGSRARDTNPQGAADIVVDPTRPVRAPVTGTVVRAGTYALYCDAVDHYLVVEPDARPGWEVKLLHFEGLSVDVGDRVRAGVTQVGTRARLLPFASQVDRHTVAPHWPHLHLEVVDTAVPDRPSGATCD